MNKNQTPAMQIRIDPSPVLRLFFKTGKKMPAMCIHPVSNVDANLLFI